MVGTILPIGYGERRQDRRVVAPWLFAGGALASAAAFGALLALVGTVLRGLAPEPHVESLRIVLTGSLAAIYAAREAGVTAIRVPELRRQVPEWWRRTLPPRVASLFYGLALGPGIGTYVMTGAFYVVLAWAALSGDLVVGVVLMALHAVGKSLPLLGLGTRAARGHSSLAEVPERLGLAEPAMRRMVFVALTAVSLLSILHWLAGGGKL